MPEQATCCARGRLRSRLLRSEALAQPAVAFGATYAEGSPGLRPQRGLPPALETHEHAPAPRSRPTELTAGGDPGSAGVQGGREPPIRNTQRANLSLQRGSSGGRGARLKPKKRRSRADAQCRMPRTRPTELTAGGDPGSAGVQGGRAPSLTARPQHHRSCRAQTCACSSARRGAGSHPTKPKRESALAGSPTRRGWLPLAAPSQSPRGVTPASPGFRGVAPQPHRPPLPPPELQRANLRLQLGSEGGRKPPDKAKA